jgi:hypothetical protein
MGRRAQAVDGLSSDFVEKGGRRTNPSFFLDMATRGRDGHSLNKMRQLSRTSINDTGEKRNNERMVNCGRVPMMMRMQITYGLSPLSPRLLPQAWNIPYCGRLLLSTSNLIIIRDPFSSTTVSTELHQILIMARYHVQYGQFGHETD